MEQTLTAKVQIYPDPEQKELLLESMYAYQCGCNFVSKHVYETHDLSQSSLNRALYRDLRDRFGLRSQMAQSAIRTVIGSYRSLVSNGREWARAEYKTGFYDLVWNRDYSLFADGTFSVNTLSGRVKVPYAAKGMEKYFDKAAWRFGTASVLSRNGKFYLHISVTGDVPDEDLFKIVNVCGVDLGINFHAVSYDGAGKAVFYPGREAKEKRARFAETRSELQRRKTPSARRRLKEIGRRENRWMRDVNHCVSKALAESNPDRTLFVLEDLSDIRGTLESVKKPQRYVQVSWAYGELAGMIAYKAARKGSSVIFVDPRFTSQACPKCGHAEPLNRDKARHRFLCRNCGYQSNDDRVGAMNLHRKGIEYLSNLCSEAQS